MSMWKVAGSHGKLLSVPAPHRLEQGGMKLASEDCVIPRSRVLNTLQHAMHESGGARVCKYGPREGV
jgi:hypothetical protein